MQKTLLLALIATAATSCSKLELKPDTITPPNNIRKLPIRNGRHSADVLNPVMDADTTLAPY